MGMFDVWRVGRTGDVGGGEDQEMINKLKRSGSRLYYSPDIAVSHKAPPARVTKPYFRKWFYAAGRDKSRDQVTRTGRNFSESSAISTLISRRPCWGS